MYVSPREMDEKVSTWETVFVTPEMCGNVVAAGDRGLEIENNGACCFSRKW